MKTLLSEMRIAALVEDGFDHDDIAMFREIVEKAGVTVDIMSTQSPEVKGFNKELGETRVKADKQLNTMEPASYDALYIPGGREHAESMRRLNEYENLLSDFHVNGGLIAASMWGVLPLAESRLINTLPAEVEEYFLTGKSKPTETNQILLNLEKSGTHTFAERILRALKSSFHAHV